MSQNPYAPDHDQDPGSPDAPDVIGQEEAEPIRDENEARTADVTSATVRGGDLPASPGATDDAARGQGL